MDDIAEHLGISKYSVSRALAGKPGVSDETRQRVLNAARELGYRVPSRDGGSGRPRGRNLVLIIRSDEVHDHEFWMEVIAGCEGAARSAGFNLITRPLGLEEMKLQPSLDDVAGLIVAGSRARPAMEPYTSRGIPTVLITYPKPLEPYDTVTGADWEGGYAVGEHLLKLGHKRMVFVSDTPEKPSHAHRFKGFRAALEAAGDPEIQVKGIAIDSRSPGASFEKAFMEMADGGQRPTAVFCATDGLALTVMWALNRNDLEVPRDVSVVGCNGIMEAERSVPKLTTLEIPKRLIGSQAVRTLIERIGAAGAPHVPRRLSLIPTLIIRESTAAPAVRAPV